MGDPITSSASQADIDKISAWNWHGDGYTPPVIDALIHEQISQHIISQPDAPAVCAHDGSFTYSELNAVSNLIVDHLQTEYDIGPGAFVPLCFEKSKWNIVAMLSVLKAGAAFVPLDPNYPVQRMQTIIQLLGKSFGRVIMTSKDHRSKLSGLRRSLLQVDAALLSRCSHSNPVKPGKLHSSAAALVIFTSGSTGTPKGIVGEHRTYCSAATYHGPAMKIDKDARVFQFAAHTFDVSLCDILTTLIRGGCVCIPSEAERMDDVAGAISRLGVNHLHLTPTVACMINPAELRPGANHIVLGGEALTRQAVEVWSRSANVIQSYGPAEAGVACTVRQGVQLSDPLNLLGRPVGSSIWIVDPNDHDKLVPIGTEGELLIEGPIVARGYLSNEEQTNKSFIHDPKWVQLTKVKSGRRFYKTGDLGRHGPNGEILIVGRCDFQVKLRGQRIEMGEVEHQVSVAMGTGAKVCVAAVTPKDGNKMLATFVAVGDEGGECKPGDMFATSPETLERFRKNMEAVKQRLQECLPPYMIPSVFLPLHDLPLTTSGKIERKRLCEFAEGFVSQDLAKYTSTAETDTEMLLPTTHKEEILCKVWQDVLHLEEVSTDDDFFHLGGDSAKAMILVSALRKLGFTLTVADVMKNPRLSPQAHVLKQGVDVPVVAPFSILSDSDKDHDRVRKEAAAACGVETSKIHDAYPITEMQQRWFFGTIPDPEADVRDHNEQEEHDHARRMIFTMAEGTNVQRLLDAWRSVVKRHEILRTRFVRDSKYDTIQVIVDGEVPVDTHDCSLDEFLTRDQADRMTMGRPLIRVAAGKHAPWFLLTMSHAIYDGMSLDMVFAQVRRAYDGELPDRPNVHMNHLIKYIAEGNKDVALKYWRTALDEVIIGQRIGSHMPVGRRIISDVVRKKLIKVPGALRPGENWANIIQVAAAIAVSHQHDNQDVIFDCHLSGRAGKLPGAGDFVGPTLTSLPVIIPLGKTTDSIGDVLARLHEHMLEITKHECMGYVALMQYDDIRQKIKGAPLVNIMAGGEAPGSRLGLEIQKTIAHNEVPFFIMATMKDSSSVELLVGSDEGCVSTTEVEKILEDYAVAFQEVWASRAKGSTRDGLRICDVTDCISNETRDVGGEAVVAV